MDTFLNYLMGFLALIVGGGFLYFKYIRKDSNSFFIPTPPKKENLDKIGKEKKDVLEKQDPETFIDDNLDNPDDINDVKHESDSEFDRIRNKHKRKHNLD